MFDVKNALMRLSGANAPAGYEENAANIASELLHEFTEDVRIDRLGNVIGRVSCAKKDAKTVLWDAHLDEVGVMITGHENGYLRFQSIGGVDARVLPTAEIVLMTEPPITGFVSCLPPHVQDASDYDKAEPIDKLFIDAGLRADEAEKLVPAGTAGCYAPSFTLLGEKLVSGKAFDDRACFVALLLALDMLRGKPLPADIAVVGSVQEETGAAGAFTAAYGTAPDIAFAADVTFGYAPDGPKERTFPLGSGVAIGVGPHMDRTLSKTLIELAKEHGIPHEREIMAGSTGTNGGAYQISREGVPTAVLSVPLRYMHTPVETLRLDDIGALASLLSAWMLSPKGGFAL